MRAVLSGEADGVGGGWVRGFMRQRVAMPAHILLLDAGNPLENEIAVGAHVMPRDDAEASHGATSRGGLARRLGCEP